MLKEKVEAQLEVSHENGKLFKKNALKVLAFLGKLKSSDKDNYGFKTMKCPPSVTSRH